MGGGQVRRVHVIVGYTAIVAVVDRFLTMNVCVAQARVGIVSGPYSHRKETFGGG